MMRRNNFRACTVNTSDSSYDLCNKNYPKAYLNASVYPPGTFEKKYNICCPTKADYDAGYAALPTIDKGIYIMGCPVIADNTSEFCKNAYVGSGGRDKREKRMRACTANTSDASYYQCKDKYPKAFLNASIYRPGTFDKKYNLCCPTQTDYLAGYKAMSASDKAVYMAGCPEVDQAVLNFCKDS